MDGWEQLRQDFAYWRAFSYLAEHGANGDDRAYFIGQRDLRQDLIARDIGYWGHFVGDASQPLHVSIHYNGWGDYPNPNGYSESKDVHAHFEGAFVRDHVNAGAVVNLIKPSTETAPAQALTQSQISGHRRRISGRNVEDGAAVVRRSKNAAVCRRQPRSGRLSPPPASPRGRRSCAT